MCKYVFLKQTQILEIKFGVLKQGEGEIFQLTRNRAHISKLVFSDVVNKKNNLSIVWKHST